MTESGTLFLLLGLSGLVVVVFFCSRLLRRPRRISPVRRPLAIPVNSPKPAGGLSRKSPTEDALATLLGLAAVALVGVVTFKGLQKGFTFLKGLDWESLDPVIKEAIGRFGVDIEKIHDNRARLDRAEALLLTGDKISIEQAAMLASAALEAGLKTLCQRHSIGLEAQEAEGMATIASILRDRSIISPHECSEVRRFASRVRNKVMHGDFDTISEGDVREQIRFAWALFGAHGLTV